MTYEPSCVMRKNYIQSIQTHFLSFNIRVCASNLSLRSFLDLFICYLKILFQLHRFHFFRAWQEAVKPDVIFIDLSPSYRLPKMSLNGMDGIEWRHE
jgi:hypothetical protein